MTDADGPTPTDVDDAPAGATGVPRPRPVEPRPTVTRRLAAWWGVAAVGILGVAGFLVVPPARAGLVLGAACVLAAVLRAVLPTQWAGGLVVRRRTPDSVMFAVLGAGMVTVSLLLQNAG